MSMYTSAQVVVIYTQASHLPCQVIRADAAQLSLEFPNVLFVHADLNKVEVR